MPGTKTIRVNRWGNGFGIRLPKEFVISAGITETSQVEVKEIEHGLMISCVRSPRRHIPLSERLKGWDGQPYELASEDKSWLDTEPAGEEIW